MPRLNLVLLTPYHAIVAAGMCDSLHDEDDARVPHDPSCSDRFRSNSMKVLIVSPDEESGGVAAVVRNLTQYLLARDHRVQMFYPGRSIFIRSRVGNVGPSALSLRLQLPLGERHPLVNFTLFLIRFPVALAQLLWLI